jgi:thiamine-phosphate pyrophosphorylase
LLAGGIYGITSEAHSLGRTNVDVVKQMIAAGIKVIQYREKEKPKREMLKECMDIREATERAGVTFIINDHVDLALLTAADGVHIGQEDLPPQFVRKLVGPKMLIGLSTHSAEQAHAAEQSGMVNYIGVGPLFATQTKKDVCKPVGLEYLEYVVTHIQLPFVAIGGIKDHNLKLVKAHGAKMVALVTDIVGAVNIKEKVAAVLNILAES